MVVLLPNNPNPTRADIDAYFHESVNQGITEIQNTIREIHSKSGAGALLHPAEEYFLEAAAAAARITP